MNYKLRDYIENLFENAPRTHKVYDLKDELLMNLNDKYDDLIRAGKSEEEAFKIVTVSIGDIHELLQGIDEIAITKDKKADRKKTALIKSVSVSLYILSIAVLILIEEVLGIDNSIGVVIMLAITALPTGLLIYHFMSMAKEDKSKQELVEWQDDRDNRIINLNEKTESFEGWKDNKLKKKKIKESISSITWTIITVIYLWSSFALGSWAYSWIIFIIGAAIQSFIKLIIELDENDNKKTCGNISSIIWSLITAIYLWISFAFGLWAYSWIIFIIGAAIQNIIKLAFELKER